MNTKIIKLDLNRILYDKIIAKQGDTKSRFLLFQLLDGSIPFCLTNRSVRAYMVKPDGKEIFNDLIINNYSLGYCTLELTNQVLAVPGTVKIELMVTEEDRKLTSSVFELEVIKSINSEKSIVSTNEFTALLNGLSSLSEYDNYKNEIAAARDGEVNLLTKVKKIDEQLDTNVQQINEIKNTKVNEEDVYKKFEVYTQNETNALISSITKGDKGDPGTASIAIDDTIVSGEKSWTSDRINNIFRPVFGLKDVTWSNGGTKVLTLNLGDNVSCYIYNFGLNGYQEVRLGGKYTLENYRNLVYRSGALMVDNKLIEGDILICTNIDGKPVGSIEHCLNTNDIKLNAKYTVFTNITRIIKDENKITLPADNYIYFYSIYGGYEEIQITRETEYTLNNYESLCYNLKSKTLEKVYNTTENRICLIDFKGGGELSHLLVEKNKLIDVDNNTLFDNKLIEDLTYYATETDYKYIVTRTDCAIYHKGTAYKIAKGEYSVGRGCILFFDMNDNTIKSEKYNTLTTYNKYSCICLAVRGWNYKNSEPTHGYFVDIINQKKLMKLNNSDNIPTYFETYINTKYKNILSKMSTNSRMSFSFPFITDMHLEYNSESGSKLIKWLDRRFNFPYIVNGGDISDYNQDLFIKYMTMNDTVLHKTLYSVGNHEFINNGGSTTAYDNSGYAKIYNEIVSHFENKNIKFNEDDENSVYYYYDDNVNKVRIITIDALDWSHYEKQKKWICKVLDEIKEKEDWGIIIISHYLPTHSSFKGSGGGKIDEVVKPIFAYANKTTYNSYNFTTAKCQIMFIACGHTHWDNLAKVNNVNIFSSVNDSMRVETYEGLTAPTKTLGTITECSFEVITIDKKLRKVYLTKIGAGEDREFTY